MKVESETKVMFAIEWLPEIILWINDLFIFLVFSFLFFSCVISFLSNSKHYFSSVFILEKLLKKHEST